MAINRETPLEISPDEFKRIGYQLVDMISYFIETIEEKPVTWGETPSEIQAILGNATLPEAGISASQIFSRTTELLLNHSLLNGHPKFLGYVTSSAAPIGALADLLAAAINPNVGANILSPVATAIEKQTIQWLAEFIGVSPTYGGLLVSGGNMANFNAFLAARTAKGSRNLKEKGIVDTFPKMLIYASKATHAWIEKAAVLFGHGLNAIRWIPTDANNRINTQLLKQAIDKDIKRGKKPFLVVGNAGDVSTGAVDNLSEIASICRIYDLWFHIDGAYGIPAAVLPQLKDLFEGLEEADSIALDPHKWLYAPLEVGCTLVKNPQHLLDTFSSHPAYYNFNNQFEEPALNYYEYGLQNSRGFRALKVWMALQQVGKNGYIQMINDDIELAKLLFELAKRHPELEAVTHNLSIATLRYIPSGYLHNHKMDEAYLNNLNEKLLNELQHGGEVFLSNAIISEKYCLRGCVVNFRTSKKDIEEIVEIIVRKGREIHQKLQENEVTEDIDKKNV